MNPLLEAAAEIQQFLEQNNLPFCFIGGIAVIHFGETRITSDIDISLLCGYGNEQRIISLLLSKFPTRISGATEFAMQNRVLLLRSSSGIPVDITLTAISYEEEIINAGRKEEIIPGVSLRLPVPEDLVVMKAFANRPKDWQDIQGIVLRRKHTLDTNYIFDKLKPLAALKEPQPILNTLRSLLSI